MSYAAPNLPPFADNVMWFGNPNSIGALMLGQAASLAVSASTAWPTANKAIYVPFVLNRSATLYRVGWHNGATAAGSVDCGVYDAGGAQIITSGATAQGTINTMQFVDVTDTLLRPGQYWLACSATLVTTTMFARTLGGAVLPAAAGVLTQVTANPLPATATFALDNTLAYVPVAVLQMRSVM